ncbi:flagellar type III secretion system protein FlhB [Primorskyibacter sp. S187A]|uniref:flagellar type III secretion system protein FlhB n=1 Tax=Primorskyibacter sp. S187A TaxID=3415130 RepID=UPI003C7A2D27
MAGNGGGEEDGADKSFEATQKKLDDARKKGDFARSTDLNTTAMYLGFLITALAVGGGSLLALGDALSVLIARSHDMAPRMFEGQFEAVFAPALPGILMPLMPFVIVPAIFVIGSLFVQRGFVFAGSKLKPKISRLSLVQNMKNKFGSKGLFEFAKSAVKMGLYAWLLFAYLQFRFNDIVLSVIAPVDGAILRMLNYAIEFLAIAFCVSLVIGGIDYLWQHFEHLKKQRMSHKELRDEMKESEGDPHLKQARRSKAEHIALNTMLSDVPDADVVVVNPTHYAVALKWSRAKGTAPEVVAKGVDEIALKIREIATENGVPIHSDPPTARALHAGLDIGDEISPEHYKAVAAAIRFSDAMRAKVRGRSR